MQTNLPILYTFIRCPWAMRARLALNFMNIPFETREVDLKSKPQSLLNFSPKGTVPVLILNDGTILEESLDIILWAMPEPAAVQKQDIFRLIDINDDIFKDSNYRYKYAESSAEQQYYRSECEKVIVDLEQRLSEHTYLIDNQVSIADLALFPIVRQFSKVDSEWFAVSPYANVRRWLDTISASEYFAKTMQKAAVWEED